MHDISNDLTMTRLSEFKFRVKVYKNPDANEPYDLSLLDLLLIAKVKIADADDDAVFQLTNQESSAIILDPDITENNELIITVASGDTASCPPTKDTTLRCELIVTSDQRKTLGRFPLTVLASLKQSV